MDHIVSLPVTSKLWPFGSQLLSVIQQHETNSSGSDHRSIWFIILFPVISREKDRRRELFLPSVLFISSQ